MVMEGNEQGWEDREDIFPENNNSCVSPTWEKEAENCRQCGDVEDEENVEESIAPDQEEQEEIEEIAELKAALIASETEKEEYFRRLQRLQADFDNYRRRMDKERQELIGRANERLIFTLLPVLDNLERVLEIQREPENETIISGVEMIYRQFLEVLNREGVVPIRAVGEEFDPQKHEAVMQVEESGAAQNIVVEELQRGYLIQEKVLRPSMVKVAK
ncbi:MAG: nucleotide exchange factor GrpE [bacterium]|jgi:molecular chaperone GrpE